MKNQKLTISIDATDWGHNEEERDVAVNTLENLLDDLSDEDYQTLAAFIYLEQISGGEFEFFNRRTGNALANRMCDLMLTLQKKAMFEACKDWRSYPSSGCNLELFIN